MDVAVKIIEHDSATAALVANEVKLIMSFDHANVVRAFHCTTWVENPKVPTPPTTSEALGAEVATSGILSPFANARRASSGLGTLARAGSGAAAVTGAALETSHCGSFHISLQSTGSSPSLRSGALLPAGAAAAGGPALAGTAQQQQQHEHSSGSGDASFASAAVAARRSKTLPAVQGHSITSNSTSSSNIQELPTSSDAAAGGMGQKEGSSSRGFVRRLMETVGMPVYHSPAGAVYYSGGTSRTFSTSGSGAVTGITSVTSTTGLTSPSRSQKLQPVISEVEIASLSSGGHVEESGRGVGEGGNRDQASLEVSPAAAATAAATGIPMGTVVEIQQLRGLQQFQEQQNVFARRPAVVAEVQAAAADSSERIHGRSGNGSSARYPIATLSQMEVTPTIQQSGQGFSSEGVIVGALGAMDTGTETTGNGALSSSANASRVGDVALLHLPSSNLTSSSMPSGQQRMTHVVMNLEPEMGFDTLPTLDLPAEELNKLFAMLPSSSTNSPDQQQQQHRETGRRRRSSFDTGGYTTTPTSDSGSGKTGRGGEGGTPLVGSIPMAPGAQRRRPRKKKEASEKAQTWLVLEFCDGGTLADLLQSYASTAEEPTSSVSLGLGGRHIYAESCIALKA